MDRIELRFESLEKEVHDLKLALIATEKEVEKLKKNIPPCMEISKP